jgi:uncharacterized iron-regulated membrane protein
MSIRIIFKKIHQWLGLVSGLLVFIIAITGALYAFQEEITAWANDQKIEQPDRTIMPPSLLAEIAQKALPGKELHAIKYNGAQKSAEGIFYSYQPDYYFIVYLDPYTGEVKKVKDMNKDFFRFIMKGHFYLWLPPHIGQPLVASSTLVFVLILISGIVLWIPKNRKALKNKLKFQWTKGTRWPRMNFDLHVVGGFYVTLFALIFAITGLVWGFQWFARGYHQLAGGEKSLVYEEVYSMNQQPDSIMDAMPPLDRVWGQMQQEYPEAASIEVHPALSDSAVIAANANQKDGKYWKTDYRYFDQHTLQEINVNNVYGRFKDARFADKLYRMNYEIHTGAILGLPGKIFAFLMSLFIASLPVTGFIIWWKKRKTKG